MKTDQGNELRILTCQYTSMQSSFKKIFPDVTYRYIQLCYNYCKPQHTSTDWL